MTTNYTNGHKIFQMVMKYTNIYHSKALQNVPKLGFLVRKQTIWQTWRQSLLLSRRVFNQSD
jgi:hypothetical protein